MAGKKYPDRLINFNVFLDGYLCLGAADVELPNITPLTETLSGAGFGGEMEVPILGMFESMETSINWRTITDYAIKLAAPGTHYLEFRAAQQTLDTSTGKLNPEGIRVAMKVMNKETGLGSFEMNATTDTEQTFEVSYFQLFKENKELIEIDKPNCISKFEGVDYLKAYRKKVGME
ncbi:MAG: phage major tail tube protein [Lentisphaeria bacterium]|nr:phage major tail tube protein [Lentisphaeria bacterium]